MCWCSSSGAALHAAVAPEVPTRKLLSAVRACAREIAVPCVLECNQTHTLTASAAAHARSVVKAIARAQIRTGPCLHQTPDNQNPALMIHTPPNLPTHQPQATREPAQTASTNIHSRKPDQVVPWCTSMPCSQVRVLVHVLTLCWAMTLCLC